MSASCLDPHDYRAVRSAPMFSALPSDTLDELLAQSQVQVLPRRTLLFEQDERASVIYLVLDGWVKLFRMTAGGDEAVVGVFARGDSIAEAPCLMDAVYPVSAETATDARLLAIRARCIMDMARSRPEVCLTMLASISAHLKTLVDQIEELKARTGPQRLAGFLVGLAPVSRGTCTFALPYEKLIIAGRLGMKPESLSRAFQRLQSVGVRTNQGVVAVSDVARLAEFAERERPMAVRCPLLRTGCSPG